MITINGLTIFGANVSLVQFFDISEATNSVTFDETAFIEARMFCLGLQWYNPTTTATKLLLRPNGVALPSGSGSAKEQYNISQQVREDAASQELVIAELTSGVANSWYIGSNYFIKDTQVPARMYMAWGYAQDSATVLGDRKRKVERIGMYNDSTTALNTFTIQTDNGLAAIGPGSRLYAYYL
jgi:hypothetical protein